MQDLAQKQPNITNVSIPSPFSPFGEIELEACRLRFEGHTSAELEIVLARRYGDRGPKAKTIRNWFARGGRLYDFNKSYVEEETQGRHTLAQQVFSAHVKNAARTIVLLMNDPNQPAMIRFRTAQYIINRELGLPTKAVPVTETKDPATRILERMGLIPKKETNN